MNHNQFQLSADHETRPHQFMSEPHFDAKQKQDASTRKDSQTCHLRLEGELTYMPEYRSQFVSYPIERSHSIPQLSNISFQGKFVGVPEYTDSFRCYDHFTKSEPIRKQDHLGSTRGSVVDTVVGSGEYTENYKHPDQRSIDKTMLVKQVDKFHLLGDHPSRLPEYSESFKDPKITVMPERAKARDSILSLKGNMDYTPEYR